MASRNKRSILNEQSPDRSGNNSSFEVEAKRQRLHFPENDCSKSPHTLQNKSAYYKEFTPKSRYLSEDSPAEKYVRRTCMDKTTIHFGQRKLLLSEIEFLTIVTEELWEKKMFDKKVILIYAGAAPGTHTALLANMFPFIDYILVDPSVFKIDLSTTKAKIELKNDFFTNEMAQKMKDKYKECELLFVSDIRTANCKELSEEETERRIQEDMTNQMEWYKILNPFKSMFKFRLPYVEGRKNPVKEVEYLDGLPYLQIWEGKTSTETRLIVDKNAPTKVYDSVRYEDMLFRFNTVERVLCYKHNVQAPGIDHCYDCRAEVFILERYINALEKIEKMCRTTKVSLELKLNSVRDYIIKINEYLSAGRRTDRFRITLNGKIRIFNLAFTEIYYGVDLSELLNLGKIADRPFVKYYSSDEEPDDVSSEQFKHTCTSPHTLQSLQYDKCTYKEGDFSTFRELTDETRQKARPKGPAFIDKSTIYFKERSLRLSEIEFLTVVCKDILSSNSPELKYKKIVLIYAGCAPTKNIHELHEMFPFIKFVLYDPKKIELEEKNSMIEIKQEYFTDEIALSLREIYSNYTRIFISNIKRAENFVSKENILLEKEDMQIQMSCYNNLAPYKSMIRFTIPFPDIAANTKSDIRYLEGKMLFKLWSHWNKLETCLILNENANLRNYDYVRFKNQLHYFNSVQRVQCYRHDVDIDGLDHCYDCRGEVYVFDEYIKAQPDIFKVLYKRNKYYFRNTNIKNYIEKLNNSFYAEKRYFQFEYDKKKYVVRFTDLKYNKPFETIFNDKSIQVSYERKNDERDSINKRSNDKIKSGVFNRIKT